MEVYEVKVFNDGTKFWYQDGKLHRLDGPACEYVNGTKVWFQNDKRHRLDGPAVEWRDGTKFWYQNDKLHRLDGPAMEYPDGDKSWYIEGILYYSEELFNEAIDIMNGIVYVDGIKYQKVEEE